MPSYDITFCTSEQCPMRQSCFRGGQIPEGAPWASVAQFYEPEVECTMYWPVECLKEKP